MTTPAPLRPRQGDFAKLIDSGLRFRIEVETTADCALKLGVNPELLIRYVRGSLTSHELVEAESMVAHSPWALSQVIALTKARRKPLSVGACILRATDTDPYAWGIENTGDRDMDIARLLEQVGCNEGRKDL